MKNRIYHYLYFGLLLFMVPITASAQSQIKMMEVIFQESEPGIEPYFTRYLLSNNYLRLDDGDDQGDFILFDLHDRFIHSFNHEDKTHLKIAPRKYQAIDSKLDFNIVKIDMTQAPKIKGNAPVGYELQANGQSCKHVVSVDGLMPEVTRALKDYEAVLVEQAKTTLSRVPVAFREPCYMANNYLYADAYLDGGFPLQVIDYLDKQKKLVSHQTVMKSDDLIRFPIGYRVYTPN